MSATYFQNFPKRYYDVRNSGVFEVMTDISRNVDTNDSVADNTLTYLFEPVQDGERPDAFSFRLYGTSDYYWTFFIVNDQLREGLRDAWHMSSHSFERMLEDNYDVYSVFTLLPKPSANGSQNDLSILLFDDVYLPYLEFGYSVVTRRNPNAPPEPVWVGGKVLKYDDQRLQLWLKDVNDVSKLEAQMILSQTSTGGRGIQIPRARFRWVNPFVEGTDEWTANRALQLVWMQHVISQIALTDPAKYADYQNTEPPTDGIYSTEQFDALENYTLDNAEYDPLDFWASARNAPNSYYDASDPNITISAFDALTLNPHNPNTVLYFEHETETNDAKRLIRIVRPEFIRKFSTEFFENINK